MVKTGVITKLKKDTAIVITKDFSFIEIKLHAGMIKGQTIKFLLTDYKKSTSKKKFNIAFSKYLSVSSIAALFIAAFIMLYIKPMYTDYKYVDIDINPSLEIVLNSSDQVLEVTPFNDDARTLLSDLNLKKMAFKDALSIILEKSATLGYLKNTGENTVLFSTTLKDDSSNVSDTEKIKEVITKIEATTNTKVNTETINSSLKIRNQALDNSLSSGRYSIYMQAKNIGMEISIEEAKNDSIAHLLAKLNTPIAIDDKIPTPSGAPITDIPAITSSNQETPTESTEKVTTTPEASPLTSSTTKPPIEIEPTHTITQANTPKNTVLPTPTIQVAITSSSNDSISLKMYNQTKGNFTKEINPRFLITNTGKTSIMLSDTKLRYYYTSEHIKNQIFKCDWFSNGNSNISGSFMPCATKGSSPKDYYLEISFNEKAGSLAPKESIELILRITTDYQTKPNDEWNSFFNQDDDYSYNANASSYKDWGKVPVFVKDKLIFGNTP